MKKVIGNNGNFFESEKHNPEWRARKHYSRPQKQAFNHKNFVEDDDGHLSSSSTKNIMPNRSSPW